MSDEIAQSYDVWEVWAHPLLTTISYLVWLVYIFLKQGKTTILKQKFLGVILDYTYMEGKSGGEGQKGSHRVLCLQESQPVHFNGNNPILSPAKDQKPKKFLLKLILVRNDWSSPTSRTSTRGFVLKTIAGSTWGTDKETLPITYKVIYADRSPTTQFQNLYHNCQKIQRAHHSNLWILTGCSKEQPYYRSRSIISTSGQNLLKI